jgi:hypothetical protein
MMIEHEINSTSNLIAVEPLLPSIAAGPGRPDASACSRAIVTLTPGPRVDRAYEVPRLCRGAVLCARFVRVDGGGKGVNPAQSLLLDSCWAFGDGVRGTE